jgi:dihydrofolate reductase
MLTKGKSASGGRKIIVLTFVSLDSVMQAPGGPEEDTSGGFKYGGWTFPYFDEEAGELMGKQMSGKYDLLLGRKTYDIFASYWPTHTDGWPQVNKIKKYVVSKNLKKTPWENSVVLRGVNEIKKLKKENGSPLQVHGSSNMIQTLFKNDLVDELWLKIFPITLGKGKKFFADGTIPAGFRLIESKVTKSGVIFANYKREGKVKTGSFA